MMEETIEELGRDNHHREHKEENTTVGLVHL
jgi:hypothetical protein